MKEAEQWDATQTLPVDLMAPVVEPEQTSSPRMSLVLYSRDGVFAVALEEGRPQVIGRSRPSDVTIRDRRLSRQHAYVELVGAEVWIEDLQSTNGTTVNGQRIDRACVGSADVIVLGDVTARVHRLLSSQPSESKLYTHERLQRELAIEVDRAHAFRRGLAFVMLQGKDPPISHWLPRIEQDLRPYMRAAVYSGDIVELLIPETDVQGIKCLAERLVGADSLRCGVAVYPFHATTADSLVDAARMALRRTTQSAPIMMAEGTDVRDVATREPHSHKGVVAFSPRMREVLVAAERVASSALPVLILGETGTGKEVVAQLIHRTGSRREGRICCVNCGAIAEQLIQSTLFGHTRGAFTGAVKDTPGVFESAQGGTVFLDEIGELPMSAQAVLLRVIETKQVSRLGSNREVPIDVRILAATHRDLEQMCLEGRFREDLLYRINAVTIEIPPLRDRPEDVVPLAHRFLKSANEANGSHVNAIDEEALALLRGHGWPGNVRELRNAIERAVVISQSNTITIDDLPARVRDPRRGNRCRVDSPHEEGERSESDSDEASNDIINLRAELERRESELIIAAIRRARGDRKQAAINLGLPLRTLSHKMQVHGIRKTGTGYEIDDAL